MKMGLMSVNDLRVQMNFPSVFPVQQNTYCFDKSKTDKIK